MTTAAEYTDRVAAVLARGQAQHDPLDEDLSGWPADVVEMVQVVCKLWHLRAPALKKSKAHWIQGARMLDEACGEFGVTCLEEYRAEFEEYMSQHGGLARHPVCGPGSLVNMVRDCAGRMRAQTESTSGTVVDKKQDASYYLDDIYAQYTEH